MKGLVIHKKFLNVNLFLIKTFLIAKFDCTSYPIFQGPESFAVQGDYLYTGVQGGDILRLNINDPKKPWEFVTKIGELCQDTHHENICGRPLG